MPSLCSWENMTGKQKTLDSHGKWQQIWGLDLNTLILKLRSLELGGSCKGATDLKRLNIFLFSFFSTLESSYLLI